MALVQRQLDELFAPIKNEYVQHKRKLGRQLKIAISSLIFGLFLIQLLLAFEYALLSVGGQNLNSKLQELKIIQLENEKLKAEVDQLQSLDRIESIATIKLGMILPKESDQTFVSQTVFLNKEEKEIREAIPTHKKENSFLISIKEMIMKTFASLV